jgi:hypothetical protein
MEDKIYCALNVYKRRKKPCPREDGCLKWTLEIAPKSVGPKFGNIRLCLH